VLEAACSKLLGAGVSGILAVSFTADDLACLGWSFTIVSAIFVRYAFTFVPCPGTVSSRVSYNSSADSNTSYSLGSFLYSTLGLFCN
jgi:hypothetical protein